jgi:FtsH-binding integral membrane protein
MAGGRSDGAVHRRVRAAGYASRRDLSALARALFCGLIGLIVFGIVTIFVQIRSPTARSLASQSSPA